MSLRLSVLVGFYSLIKGFFFFFNYIRLVLLTGRGFWGFYFFNLDFRWLLGVDLVGFVLN